MPHHLCLAFPSEAPKSTALAGPLAVRQVRATNPGQLAVSIGEGDHFLFFFFFFNVFYLFLKERGKECKWGRGGERGRQRIRSGLCTEPDAGLEPANQEITT